MISPKITNLGYSNLWADMSTILGYASNFEKLIAELFANNEQGFFYDPKDLSTMFQDAAGTVPVTAAGQPVGLIRDKSGRNNHAQQTTSARRPLLQYEPILGHNLITNGDFSNGGTGWETAGTPTFTFDTGRAYYNGVGGTGSGNLKYDAGMTVGKTYKISYDYEVIQYAFMAGVTSGVTVGGRNITGKGRRHFIFTVQDARNKGVFFGPENTSVFTCEFYIDNVTVQEVIGYNSAIKKVEYDGVDDKLITNLPSVLTDCTVLRAIPNEGTQVKYNQSLPLLYEDSTNHVGLLAINRTLTSIEQSHLIEELNKRAGVVGYAATLNKMFDNNQVGFVYDPNDLSTMFQDVTGTVPVTAVGQPVGLIRDKSGRNNHAYQTTSASRPILRKNAVTGANYLEFDGSDDFLKTNSIDFTATDKMSLFIGVANLSDNAQVVAELSISTATNAGSFYLVAGSDLGDNGYVSMARGSLGVGANRSARNFTYPAPDVAVLSTKHDISGDLSSMRRNGVVGIDGLQDKGTGNFGNYPLYIGRRGGTTIPFNGHIYGFIGVGNLASGVEVIAIEKEFANRVGVTLNV